MRILDALTRIGSAKLISSILKMWNRRGVACAICAFVIVASGCHRSYYRRQADNEAQRLIQQKSTDPRWSSSGDGSIEIDPLSRMFDPFSADHPPIPPDDPASHKLLHCVDGKRGYPNWHSNGDTTHVENPTWRSYLPLDHEGKMELDLEMAYQLALLHSPDLQTQREILYLSALDVSLERFGFDTQLFAGYNSFITNQGSDRGEGTFLSSDFGENSEGFSLTRLGVTGTTFAVGLANTILWNFSGNNTQSASSLIDFSIIQPLLRNAGRDQILEALTQSERSLLADVRQLDRFRRGFHLNIATGRNPGAGPGANFLGNPIGFGGGGGYIGLLEQQQLIRIQEFNVRQFENVLEQFREFFRRERINSLQVRQFEGTLYNAQDLLLTLKTNYQNSLDAFKGDLGLPPDLEIVIEDPLLERFEFISDEVTDRQIGINALRSEIGEQLNLIDELCPESVDVAAEDDFEWPRELANSIEDLLPYLERADKLIEDIETADRQQIEDDLALLGQVRPERVKYLEDLRASIERGEISADVEPAILQPDSILGSEELTEQLEEVFGNLELIKQSLVEIQSTVENFANESSSLNNEEIYEVVRVRIGTDISERLTQLYKIALELSLVQAQARGNSIELADVDLHDELALRIARCFRRDWMNARAALVDQWRQIEIFADQLESDVDLVFEGELGNDGNSPFSFRSANGEIRAGFRFDAPIVRLNERNNYRQALINYQQSRRDFYQFEDAIHANLRLILREISLNKILFELNRQNVRVAIEQVELAQFNLEDPSATSFGATTARDLTQAISGLQQAQNQFLSVWVDFEILRRNLDFDLGTFQFGPNNSWVDPGAIDESVAARAAAMLGINVNDQCYCDIYREMESFGMDEVNMQMEINDSFQSNQAPEEVEPPSIEQQTNPPAEPIEDTNSRQPVQEELGEEPRYEFENFRESGSGTRADNPVRLPAPVNPNRNIDYYREK